MATISNVKYLAVFGNHQQSAEKHVFTAKSPEDAMMQVIRILGQCDESTLSSKENSLSLKELEITLDEAWADHYCSILVDENLTVIYERN